MKLFTIGFTKKSAPQFFEMLIENGVETVFDVRLNNKSQLAGFTKGRDFPYFLEKIGDINYIHWIQAAPESELLKQWQKQEISWPEYEERYTGMLRKRRISDQFTPEQLDNGCLLCSEPTVEHCHRRLLAEYLKDQNQDIEIIHL